VAALVILLAQLHWLLTGQKPPAWTNDLIALLLLAMATPLGVLFMGSTRLRHRFELLGPVIATTAGSRMWLHARLCELSLAASDVHEMSAATRAAARPAPWACEPEPVADLAVRTLQAPGAPQDAARAAGNA
jgi:hypothetical protein